MLRQFILRHTDRYLARWVIFLFDLSMVSVSYVVAVLMRFNFDLGEVVSFGAYRKIGLVVVFYAIGFLISRSYVGIVRHTNITDAMSIVKGAAFAVFCLWGLSMLESFSLRERALFNIPHSILAIHFLCVLFVLIGSRLVVKSLYETIVRVKRQRPTRVLIFGAGSSGLTTLNALAQDKTRDFLVVGFLDDNASKQGKSIGGINVMAPEKAFDKRFIDRHQPDQVIISIQKSLSRDRKKEIVELALEYGLKVRIVPPLENWIRGELSARQIKDVRIEDLLGREPIVLDNVNITREIRDKVVLVSGAAGSIGSEISRQLLHYRPRQVVLLDQAESDLYDLEIDIRERHPALAQKLEVVIADVSNRQRMQRVYEAFKPDLVFHAAAYKHVPLMEDNPYEAVRVNILGTRVLADLASEHGVEKFVLVSTDKAVNPTNVMGATKRVAEIYTQSLGGRKGCSTQYIITRFGNVLGSNGSVIPLFKRQIDRGGPVTVTDKRITRYFMTIPEACNLVLEAGAMGQGGEIFVFDMGESIRIYDLALKMIKLSGLVVGKDIEILEVGLRPGEKLHEELLTLQENTKKTYHPKIMIAQVDRQAYRQVLEQIEELEAGLNGRENLVLVKCLKQMVPEFVSNNSIFASLDMKKIVNE